MSSIDPAVASVMVAQNSAIQAGITTAIQAKALDTVKQTGEALVQLIEDAGATGKELGKGDQFDRLA